MLTSPSGKKYIGQTKRLLKKRINEHATQDSSSIIHQAMKKYGKDTFTVEVLKECAYSELDYWETYYIIEMATMFPNGYNIRTGGSVGSTHCDESRDRMRQSKLGALNHNYGKPRDATTKLRISLQKSGEKHHFYGQTLCDEHKLKLAVSHRKRDEDKSLPMYLVYVKPRRPEGPDGYAVCNHPTLKCKYFVGMPIALEAKLELAIEYLHSDKSAVHRLNGNGC